MRDILQGILNYRSNELPALKARYAALATGQKPGALFFSCSDSRVIPSLMAQANPGELFEVRTVGNLVAPASGDGGLSTGDESEAAALEFALAALGVDDIVVCGHSSCGAMKAALGAPLPAEAVNLGRWLRHAAPALSRLRAGGTLDDSLSEADQLSQLNVLTQLEHVRSYAGVKRRIDSGEVRLHALWFDVPHGEVLAFDPAARKFVHVDESVAARVAGGLTI